MIADDPDAKGFSLRRWSRRKLAATRATQSAPSQEVAESASVNPLPPENFAVAASSPAPIAAPQLPPVESLTIDSDFTGFFQPKVDEALKRQALKQLLRDPRFNVMDGLDTYIDDYSQPDPISPEIVREMVQGRYIFNPPPTQVNAEGVVVDVPPEEPWNETEETQATEAITAVGSQPLPQAASAAPGPMPTETQPLVPLPSSVKPDRAKQ